LFGLLVGQAISWLGWLVGWLFGWWLFVPKVYNSNIGVFFHRVEEELLLRRSLGDLEADARRGSTSARRSFFRRKKHQRSSSRDSKELASFSNINLGWYSDSGTLNEEVALCSYQRVERLDCKYKIFWCEFQNCFLKFFITLYVGMSHGWQEFKPLWHFIFACNL